MLRKKILLIALLIVCNFAAAEPIQGQIKKQQYTKKEKTSFVGKIVIFLISAAIGTVIASHNNGRHAPENNNG